MTGLYVASNTTGLAAQFGLTRNVGALGDTLTRLSTGLRINSGKDDPAGLIASELLKAQITGTNKAISNTQRANSLIATADSAMNQIGVLLNDVKGLVVEAANTGTMTAEQISANQMQVDAALDSIDRIARTTNFGGKKILDGSLGFRTAGNQGGLSNIQINSANFGTADAIGVNVNVTQAADYARLVSNGTGVGVDTVMDIVGNRGSSTIAIGAGETNDAIAAAINRVSDSTGVIAYVEGKEQAGSVTLSSAGANNDIVITALQAGLDAGDYDFRITRGDTNDVRVVSEPGAGNPGVVEITLQSAYETRYSNFAGLFDINIDTTNRDDALNASTKINMQQGANNNVVYNSIDKAAATNVVAGKSLVAEVRDADGVNINSQLNGWTIAVRNDLATAADHANIDRDTKTIYVNSGSFADSDVLNSAIKNALANSVDGTIADFDANMEVDVSIIGRAETFANGDRFTFAGGASEGEVTITYAAGATANDILAMLNSAPNVNASLAQGVRGDTVIPSMPNGITSVNNAGQQNVESRYTSGATANEVIDLINSKLGYMFKAESLVSDGSSGGRVSYMDASAVHGDINLGNALRFTGMDNGPIVRLTNTGTNGQAVANQQLSVNIIRPNEADIKAGIHTPILEVKLATDAQGNSITTAKQLTQLFSTLTAEQTMGVSVTQLFPPGVDPNNCVLEMDGIVQPTGLPGICEVQEGDIVLLGGNQSIVADNAVAKIAGHNRPDVSTTQLTSLTSNSHITRPTSQTFVNLDTGATSISLSNALAERLDGLTIALSNVDSHHGNSFAVSGTTGTLTLAVGATANADTIASALNHALSGIGDDADQLAAINAFLQTTQGRTIESSADTAVTAADITANDIAVATTPGNVNSFLVTNNDPSAGNGPQLSFSNELAEAFDGIEFRFATGAANTSTFEDGVITLALGTGITQANLKDQTDAQLLTAIDAALASLDTTIREELGLEATSAGGPALTVSGIERNNMQIAASVSAAEETSSRTTMNYVNVSNNAQTAAVQGAVTSTAAGDETGGFFTFSFNGMDFRVDASEATPNFNMTITAGGTAGVTWTTGNVAVELGDVLTATAVFATAESFATELNSLFGATPTYATADGGITDGPGAATGPPAVPGVAAPTFTVSVVGPSTGATDHGTWDPIDMADTAMTNANLVTAIGASQSFTNTAGTPAETAAGTTILSFDNTSAMNGMTFTFTRDETNEGFNDVTGQLTIFLGSEFEALKSAAETQGPGSDAEKAADAALRAAVNGAIAANWEGIRAFTGGGTTNTSATDPVKLSDKQTSAFNVSNAIRDAANADNPFAMAGDGKTMITGSYVETANVTGTRGVSTDDAVMSITAKEAGTHMAGINIHFVNDSQNAGLQQWTNAYDASYGRDEPLPQLNVVMQMNTDGSRSMIITANLGVDENGKQISELNAGLLAKALAAATVLDTETGKTYAFNSAFDANATQFGAGTENGGGVAGSVLFTTDISASAGKTTGGYKISSGPGTSTSSGVGMIGQSDANERLVIESEELGSEQFLQVNIVSGHMNLTDASGLGANYSSGSDMRATINGILATAQGNNISINTTDLSLSMDVANGEGQTGFTITGGGALFQLGPDVVSQQQVRVGIGSMMTTELGGRDGQMYLLRSGNAAALTSDDNGRKLADRIVNQAIENLAVQRGRLGAVQRGTLEPNIASLQDSLIAMTDSNALYANADFAVESANMTRLQLLIQTGMQTLGIANQMPQYAAQLVR